MTNFKDLNTFRKAENVRTISFILFLYGHLRLLFGSVWKTGKIRETTSPVEPSTSVENTTMKV
jgi:hypothetical protein